MPLLEDLVATLLCKQTHQVCMCLQCQLMTLPHPVAHHLKWGRFINTHGGQGRNISCGLHNEHLNKLFKDIVHNLGAETSFNTYDISYAFDKVTGLPITQSAHSTIDDAQDLKQVVSVVTKAKVFEEGNTLSLKQFPLPKLNMEEIAYWISMKQQQMIKYRYAIRGRRFV